MAPDEERRQKADGRGARFGQEGIDDAHRVARAILPDRSQQEYLYDRAGNLLKAPGLEARMQAGNRLLDANENRFTYNDRDHAATREGRNGKVTYTYDSRDLLVSIDGPGLSYKAVHDALGRRTQKTVNGQSWHYYWDTDRLAAEVFPDGRLRIYVYPDAFSLVPLLFLEYDGVDADPASAKRYHVHTDHLGCPELLLDDAGHTVWRARIDAYGTAHVDVGRDFHQPLRWPGHYYDAETGLHENRFRTYSPELGRYLQCDPIGTEGGHNLYAYTDNPLREVDLRGKAKSPCPNGKDCPRRKKKEAEAGADKEGTAVRGPARQQKEPNLAELPPGKGRTPEENAEARRFYRNNREEAMKRWEEREGKTWPKDENGNPQWAEHPRPLKDGGDPLHIEPGKGADPNGPHNQVGPDGLTDHQRWGAMGPPARGKSK